MEGRDTAEYMHNKKDKIYKAYKKDTNGLGLTIVLKWEDLLINNLS
jgi:hypothetical protein